MDERFVRSRAAENPPQSGGSFRLVGVQLPAVTIRFDTDRPARYPLDPSHARGALGDAILPRPDKEVNAEIFNLIGDGQAVLNRAQDLFEQEQAQLALQVLDILLKQEPDNIEARKLHLKILEKLCEEDYCLMSRNAWVYFMDKDREFLQSKGVR